MPWPAWFGGESKAGTVYLRGYEFPERMSKHKPAGQAWRYRGKWTTYVPNRDLAYKNIDRLKPKDEEDFWRIMREAKQADLSAPPTSAADLFLSVYRERLPRGSLLRAFRPFRFGGWQQVIRHGEHKGKVYHYDLNSAYRWAACGGLPNLRTAYYTRDFTKESAVYLVALKHGVLPYRRAPGLALITSEERDFFKLHGECWPLYGVAFRSSVDLTPTFAKIDTQFPTMAKRISQSFWGMWNTREAPEQVTFKRGERAREMHNPFFNPIWSAFVTSRVKMRLAVYLPHALHVFVDAMHLTVPVPTDGRVGGWKLVGEYDSAWFRAPGQWGTGEYVMRHCGRGSITGALTDNGNVA
jgi:hypothetical protein